MPMAYTAQCCNAENEWQPLRCGRSVGYEATDNFARIGSDRRRIGGPTLSCAAPGKPSAIWAGRPAQCSKICVASGAMHPTSHPAKAGVGNAAPRHAGRALCSARTGVAGDRVPQEHFGHPERICYVLESAQNLDCRDQAAGKGRRPCRKKLLARTLGMPGHG